MSSEVRKEQRPKTSRLQKGCQAQISFHRLFPQADSFSQLHKKVDREEDANGARRTGIIAMRAPGRLWG